MHAAILSIGDELVIGQTVDTNGAWLADALLQAGVVTIEHRTVGDDRSALAKAITALAARCDLLIITGGLGPTDDDVTRIALADALCPGTDLVTDEAALERLERWFARRPGGMPAANLVQAQHPATMTLVPNPHGTAPGLCGRSGRCRVFALPGPPREMKPMFDAHVRPELDETSSVVAVTIVRAFGIGESDAAARLGDLTARTHDPLVGTTASSGILSARIRGTATAAVETAAQRVETAWAPYAYGRGDATLALAVGDLLRARGLRLAVAESCTGGWLGRAIVDVPGSSDYFVGGWIAYGNDFKSAQLGVDPALIERHGAVSAPVAEAMVRAAMHRASADRALAITGVAGPGASEQKRAGTVYVALARSDGDVSVRRFRFRGERNVVRGRSVLAALQMLRFDLIGAEADLLWEDRGKAGETAASGDVTAFIGLGSNIGDRVDWIRRGVAALASIPGVELLGVSPLFESRPVGDAAQEDFINAVARVRTGRSARELLDRCHAIERDHGRSRDADRRWGPRTLDLDLLLHGSAVIDEPGLHVPHPRMHERPFVLVPLAMIAPDVVHPVLGRTMAMLSQALADDAPDGERGVRPIDAEAASLASRETNECAPDEG